VVCAASQSKSVETLSGIADWALIQEGEVTWIVPVMRPTTSNEFSAPDVNIFQVRSSLLCDGVFPASVSIAQGSTIAPRVRSSFQEALFTIDAEDVRVTHVVLLHSVGRCRDAVRLEAKRNRSNLIKI
jgi:hypothetical protein